MPRRCETLLAWARQEIGDAARDLALAIGRLLGEAPSGRARRQNETPPEASESGGSR